jgi:hypothetical protein
MASDDKFSHLLQPIRDLEANWNIDIAHELEYYLVRVPCSPTPPRRRPRRPASSQQTSPLARLSRRRCWRA